MVKIIDQVVKENYAIYNGDSAEILKDIPDESIGFSIFSPPFLSLFTYSNSERDLGNCNSDELFWEHFDFIIRELFRVMQSGRSISIHCANIPAMKERDGYIGLKDFRGDIIRAFQKHGFIYHAEVCIWKDPLIEATRTKSLGLMYKQVTKDSSRIRHGLPDYLVTMRKPGENMDKIQNEEGTIYNYGYIGDDAPNEKIMKGEKYSHEVWRKYASPVWMDIRQTRTLNFAMARDKEDERHICPLQLDTIERAIFMWSKEGDTILTPFAGIGSEMYVALKMKRKAIGVELKSSYYQTAVKNIRRIRLDKPRLIK